MDLRRIYSGPRLILALIGLAAVLWIAATV